MVNGICQQRKTQLDIFFKHRFFSESSNHLTKQTHLGVSENGGGPQIIQFNRDFHYKSSKSSSLGYPYFWKHLLLPDLTSLWLGLTGPKGGEANGGSMASSMDPGDQRGGLD